jgi:hypothetical protein
MRLGLLRRQFNWRWRCYVGGRRRRDGGQGRSDICHIAGAHLHRLADVADDLHCQRPTPAEPPSSSQARQPVPHRLGKPQSRQAARPNSACDQGTAEAGTPGPNPGPRHAHPGPRLSPSRAAIPPSRASVSRSGAPVSNRRLGLHPAILLGPRAGEHAARAEGPVAEHVVRCRLRVGGRLIGAHVECASPR